MTTSVYDLAHSKSVPAAVTEAMLLMQDHITALEAKNERLRQEVQEPLEVILARHRIAERTKIATWLRSLDAGGGDINRFLPTTLANWIEEGMDNL